LIFLSRAFCSTSPSTKHPLKLPAHSSAFTRSSLDITHLRKNEETLPRGSDFAAPATASFEFALWSLARRSQGCEVRASSCSWTPHANFGSLM
jgi:hypothetical protein